MPQSLVVSSGTPMTATVENKAATSSSPIISEPSSPVTAPPPPATASSITRALWPTLQQQLGQQQQIMMNSSCSEKSTFVARVVSEATLDMTNMNVYNGGNMIARNLKRPTLQPRRQPQTLAEEVAATAPTSGEELDADDFDFAGIISDLAGGRFCDNAAAI